MNIEFFDGDPHAELAGRMRTLLARARRIDAVVALMRLSTAMTPDVLARSITEAQR